jgi:hypothetical protein
MNGKGGRRRAGPSRLTQRLSQVMLVYATSGQHLFAVVGALRLLYPVLETIHNPVMRKAGQTSAERIWDPSDSVLIWNGLKN